VGAAAPSGSHHYHISKLLHLPLTPPLTATVKETVLEATNLAHFGARRNDVDKYHLDATDFADRLSRTLRRVLVPEEDATSVLDYACGSGRPVSQRHSTSS